VENSYNNIEFIKIATKK